MYVLSIVVCTYNRSDYLSGCLESLMAQDAEVSKYEVIIIDNNSTDSTSIVADQFIANKGNWRVIREYKQGLSNARNRGWKEANAQYVAYLDDDARALPNWVKKSLEFVQSHPEASAFGGPYRAFALSKIPDWFPPDYGSWGLGDEVRPIKEGEWICGTNMIFKKDVLEKIGGFNPMLGMQGASIAYGEEVDLVKRIMSMGYSVFYSPEIIVKHAILDYKLNLRWLLYSSYKNGQNCVKLRSDAIGPGRATINLAKSIVKSVIRFLTVHEKYMKRRFYKSFSLVFWHVGYLIASYK